MSGIAEFISACQKAYYEGKPILSDLEYDALIRNHAELQIGPTGKVAHPYRMYSLDKVYPSRGELIDPMFLGMRGIKTPKLDGASLDCIYIRLEGVNFTLVNLVTRGDGSQGEEVSDFLTRAQILKIPTQLQLRTELSVVSVTGEVVPTLPIDNGRNIAAGSLNLNSTEEFISRANTAGLTFVAYNITPQCTDFYDEDLSYLESFGFNVVTTFYNENTPTDGIVYRLNSYKEYFDLGFTSKFPRGAIAVKEDADYIPTVLREVIWDVGVSGKVTPVAIFDEIDIDGCKISRATLNNPAFIEALDLELGCTIGVIRAGGIIPKVVCRVYD